jgi:hypothetical protein
VYVGVVDFVAVAWDDHGETSQGLELYRVNRKFPVRGHASHASATTLDALEGDEAECRFDGDDLIRCGKLLAAVHMETVDHVLIAVHKQHLVDVLFGHAADHIAVAEVRMVGATASAGPAASSLPNARRRRATVPELHQRMPC